MADYWKSNPKHFCEFCNCWFAENKSSIEHHERGKRHKDNVQKRLRELGELGKQKDKEKQYMSNSLMAMEQAAMRALQKDITNNPNMAGAYGVRFKNDSANYVPVPEISTGEPGPSKKMKVEEPELEYEPTPIPVFKSKAEKKEPSTLVKELTDAAFAAESLREGEWQELKSDKGYPYFWHTGTNAVQWEPPEGFIPSEKLQEIPLPSGNCPVEEPPLPPVKEEPPEVNIPLPEASPSIENAVKNEPIENEPEVKIEPKLSEVKEEFEDKIEQEPEEQPPAFLTLAPQKSNTTIPYGTWQTVKEKQGPVDLGLPQVPHNKSKDRIIKLEDSKFSVREKKVNTFSKEFEEFKKRKLAAKKKPTLKTRESN